MKVRVLNITKSPIKLQAGRELCSASLFTEVVDLNSIDSGTISFEE